MKDELKPCPFCGGKAKLQWVEEFYYCLSHVQCTACAARGPRSSNEAVAEEAWNARVIPKGYVKVVLCGECRWLEERVVWQAAGGEASKMYICKSPHSHMKGIARFDGDYYCSEGEAKEDTNDAV